MLEGEYPELTLKTLKHFFPDPFLFELSGVQQMSSFEKHLPLFQWKWNRGQLKLHFVCRHRLNVAKFFFEMIERWLVPGRRLDIASFFSTDFQLSAAPQTLFTLAEMTLRMDPTLPRDQVEHNLKVIETEIRLGMVSVYHASRLLETHFTSPQQKNSQVQEKITKLIQRNPDEIDYDIFGTLQQFMVMTKEEFKAHRSAHHLSRIVTASYLFMKSIEKAREERPDQRQVRLKLSLVELDLPWGPKQVLGICVGFNFLHPEEIFEERHLLEAAEKSLPGITAVEGSFYVQEGAVKDGITLYLEVEKENGFTPSDLKQLKKVLPGEIQKAIEIPLKSIFMPRNEEEILKYIVTLSDELRFVKDKPQVTLMFDEQKGGDLYFTVVLVRILFPSSYSVQYLFSQAETFLRFLPDRVKRVGLLRKRYPKEATVFRVHFSAQPFLREDQTLDLFRARQAVYRDLEKVLGPLRDYTGGMMAKQVELISEVQKLIPDPDQQLLEQFFHAIYPAEARSFLAPEQVKNWFLLWNSLLEFPDDGLKVERDPTAVYLIGLTSQVPELEAGEFGEGQLMSIQLEKHRGYLFVSSDLEEQKYFLSKTSFAWI